MDFGFRYIDIFEGNYSVYPLLKRHDSSQGKLGVDLIEDLLVNIKLWLNFIDEIMSL